MSHGSPGEILILTTNPHLRPVCGEEDFVRENICYALTKCRLVDSVCSEGSCQSGHRRDQGEITQLDSLTLTTGTHRQEL